MSKSLLLFNPLLLQKIFLGQFPNRRFRQRLVAEGDFAGHFDGGELVLKKLFQIFFGKIPAGEGLDPGPDGFAALASGTPATMHSSTAGCL